MKTEKNIYSLQQNKKMSLTKGTFQIASLVEEYKKHRDNKLYDAVMDVIVRANMDKWEVESMCKALEELMKDKIAEKELLAEQKGMEKGMEKGIQKALMKLIKKRLEQNKTLEQIAEDLDEPMETIVALYNQMKEEQVFFETLA